MIKFFFWFVILQTVLVFNKFLCIGALDCELGWELRRGRCYRRMGSSSHNNGVQMCNDANGLLIMPKTAEENSTAIELLQLWGLQRMWIGLSNTNDNNEYTWEDGTRLIYTGYTSWRPGEPNGPGPMCVEVHLTGWNDNGCHRSYPIVCQQVEGITNKIKENERVTLTCGVKDMQAITSLFWTRSVNGTSVIVSQYAKGGNVTSPSLVFEHVKWTDEGLYTCHVTYISGMTQTEEANLFVDATNMCPCRCDYRRKLEHWGSKKVPSNLTREELVIELESELQKIEKELAVNKTQLSSTIRKLTSAPNKRKSSERIGLFGAAFMCIVVSFVLLIDVLTLVKFVKSSINFLNTKK